MAEIDSKFLQEMVGSLGEFLSEDLKISRYREYRLPVHFKAENIRIAMEEWEWPKNPIFVVSYPKSGTTWTTEIIRQILYGRDENLDKISKSIPTPVIMLGIGIPEKKFDVIDRIPLPRKYFNTHLREELFDFEKLRKVNGKVIYVVRNPKDQLVSWYKFVHEILLNENVRKQLFKESWDDFFNDFLQGKHGLVSKDDEWSFPDHVKGWYKHRNDKDVLLLVYEDMIKDIEKEIRRIANFLEVDLTDKEIAIIAENTSIGSMKDAAGKSGRYEANILVNKGGVGKWKNKFSVAQSEQMDKVLKAEFADSDIEFTYQL
ncbi:amine sulfotransferase-like [Styela clava]